MPVQTSSVPRLITAIAIVVGLLGAFATPVAADTTPPGDASYSQNGASAELYASSCTANGDGTVTCADQQIYIFTGKMTDQVTGVTHTNQVCVASSDYTFTEESGDYVGTPRFERGCRVDVPSGTIRIDSKLRTAVLASTRVTVTDELCEKFGCEPGSERDVLVDATWTGFGELRSSKSRGSFDDGSCRSNESFKGSARSADVVGSLDGVAVTGDYYGQLWSGRYSFRSSCTEA